MPVKTALSPVRHWPAVALLLACAVFAAEPAWAFEESIGTAYGVTQAGIARAIGDARRDFAAHPDDTVTLDIGPGVYDLSGATAGDGVIDVSGIRPGDRGRLILRGAGPGRTKLVFDRNATWIYGRDVYRVAFVGLHMTAAQYTVSQGHVVGVSPGAVVLDMEHGFPSPGELFNADRSGRGAGRYLRRYTDSATDPHLIETDNVQLAWTSAEHVTGNIWRMDLKRARTTPDYRSGDLVCIKSKQRGNAYWFFGGSDIAFRDVTWSLKSRGVFRGGIGKVVIANSVIARAPPIDGHTPCLSTPGGGPQIGQPNDPPSTDDVVENNRFAATGDDAIAFFNAAGIIRNNTVTDSFARGILLYRSPNATLENNQVVRSPIIRRGGP